MQRPDPVNMVNYTSFHARRKFLQMPIAALSIETNKNQLVIFLVAKGSNYKMLASVLRQIHASKLQRNNPLLTRNNFSTLLHLCQSDAERERIRYVVAETSSRKMKVEAALSEDMDIRESIYKLSSIKEKAILMSLGIDISSIHSDSTSDRDTESETDLECETVVDTNDAQVDCEKERGCLPNQLGMDTDLS